MIPGQNDRFVLAQPPTTATTFTSMNIDTCPGGKSFARATILVLAGTAATNQPFSVLKLQEGAADDTNVSDVVAGTGGTATSSTVGYVIPNPPGTQTTHKAAYVAMSVDLTKRERYLRVTGTPHTSATQTVAVLALLHGEGATELPNSVTEQNTGASVVL